MQFQELQNHTNGQKNKCTKGGIRSKFIQEGVSIPVLVGQIFRDLFRFISVYSGYSGILFRIFRDFFKGNSIDLGTHFLKSKLNVQKWHASF